MDELSKIWTPTKKDQSAETHTPSEIGKFLHADAHNVQTTHQKFSSTGEGGIKWNSPYVP